MLRGFFLIFLLSRASLIVAVFGFRGQKSTGSPIEIFPDMVRQPKVRAQAPLGFFADRPRRTSAGRRHGSDGLRNAAGRTTPARRSISSEMAIAPASRLQRRDRLLQHRQNGRSNWGTGIANAVTAELMERGEQRFNINCAVCHGATAAGDGIVTKQYGLATVVTFAGRTHPQDGGRRNFQHDHHTARTPCWPTDRTSLCRIAGRSSLSSRAAAQPERHAADVPPDIGRPGAKRNRKQPTGAGEEMSDRSHVVPDAGRRIFRERTALPGLSLSAGVIGDRRARPERRRRFRFSGASSAFPGFSPSSFSSRSASAVSSGPSFIT